MRAVVLGDLIAPAFILLEPVFGHNPHDRGPVQGRARSAGEAGECLGNMISGSNGGLGHTRVPVAIATFQIARYFQRMT